ncbi:MAG: succinate dehydrogenase cytochrome b558 subunit [Bacillota bacterium]
MSHYFIRKLHSLLGILPIGVFLLEHLFTNSFALKGAESFNGAVKVLESVPYLIVIELLVILLPITFHALYGLWVVYLAKNNVLKYRYLRNWFFYLQRVTAVITFIFVVYHFYILRFQKLIYGTEVSFAKMTEHLSNPWIFAAYVIGLLAAVFHLSNGLWAFLVDWGISVGPKTQRTITVLTSILFIALSVVGIRSLVAFIS